MDARSNFTKRNSLSVGHVRVAMRKLENEIEIRGEIIKSMDEGIISTDSNQERYTAEYLLGETLIKQRGTTHGGSLPFREDGEIFTELQSDSEKNLNKVVGFLQNKYMPFK